MKPTPDEIRDSVYPEARVGGFTSVDGTIEFYGRVNALLDQDIEVLDFGAGRGAWTETETSQYKKRLRNLRGKVSRVVGCDIDPTIKTNPTLDEAVVIQPDEPLPFSTDQFGLVIADYVFEHIDNPSHLSAELARVIRTDGWLCARTPNRYSIVPLLTRIIPNQLHTRVLSRAQPHRQEQDIFPTRFRLNSIGQLESHFPGDEWNRVVYFYEAEPAYHFNSSALYQVWSVLNRFMPRSLRSNLFVFFQRR